MLSTPELKSKALKLLSRIPDFTDSMLNVEFGYTTIDCRPMIEAVDNSYVFLCYERGKCTEKRETDSEDVALFWIFKEYIFHSSLEYERKNRIRYQDFRRIFFETQSKLFSYIGEPYYSMNEKRISDILQKNPYDDYGNQFALDLMEDFERIAQDLQELSNPDLDFSFDYLLIINRFVNRPYRNQFGGIRDLKAVFETALDDFELIAAELKKKALPDTFRSIVTEINIIGKLMGKARQCCRKLE